MKKYYIGYHNKPWDKKDFTIMCETENEYVRDFILRNYREQGVMPEIYTCYESRRLPENAHY